MARATKRQLERRGFSVAAFGDGASAVAAFTAAPHSFAVALVDVMMPKMDGEQTRAALHAVRSSLPVVMMSGYDGGDRIERALAAGAVGFVQKPWDPEDLVSALKAAADR